MYTSEKGEKEFQYKSSSGFKFQQDIDDNLQQMQSLKRSDYDPDI